MSESEFALRRLSSDLNDHFEIYSLIQSTINSSNVGFKFENFNKRNTELTKLSTPI